MQKDFFNLAFQKICQQKKNKMVDFYRKNWCLNIFSVDLTVFMWVYSYQGLKAREISTILNVVAFDT